MNPIIFIAGLAISIWASDAHSAQDIDGKSRNLFGDTQVDTAPAFNPDKPYRVLPNSLENPDHTDNDSFLRCMLKYLDKARSDAAVNALMMICASDPDIEM